MPDCIDEKLRNRSLPRKVDRESLDNDSTHQISVHARQGHNRVISESILPLLLCLTCPLLVRSIVFISYHCHGSIIEYLQRLS
ncbi:unnamed protein product, partial [Rotaria magnacalcarata]